MKLHFVAAVLATSVLAAPAFAQTSGARVEGVIGYDMAKVDLGVDGFDDSAEGVLFGAGIGYDFAIGARSSVGVDAEITDSSADLEVDDGTDSASLSIGRDLYAGVRFTSAVSDSVNLYGKLGYTNARIKGEFTLGGVSESDSANADGIRAGIGAQFALGANSYVGTEYRYSNYEADFSRHQVAATLGFRF